MCFGDVPQTVGVAIGQRVEENGVDHAENCAIDTNAKSDRKNRGYRECWSAKQGAQCVDHTQSLLLQGTRSVRLKANGEEASSGVQRWRSPSSGTFAA